MVALHVPILIAILLRNALTVFNLLNAVFIGALACTWAVYGDVRLLYDSFGVITVVCANVAIAVVQEYRTHRAVERANLNLDVTARVVTPSGEEARPRSVVSVGDVIRLQRGDVVVADGVLRTVDALEVDTSVLTGESEPQSPRAGHRILAGCAVLAGHGIMEVDTAPGHGAADAINTLSRQRLVHHSPMQKRINALFEWSFVAALFIAGTDVAVHAGALSVDDVRRVATLVIGIVPEGLMFFTTISLTLGAIRLANHGVVVQTITAVESFASITALCLDKTGTLTLNQMDVVQAIPMTGTLAEAMDALAVYCSATSDEGPSIDAIRRFCSTIPLDTPAVNRIPFSSARKYGAVALTHDSWLVLGAPSAVLPPSWQGAVAHDVDASGLQGKRLLVLAQSSQWPLSDASTFRPLAVVALAETVRPGVRTTVANLMEIGVEMHVLSGDDQQTVREVINAAHIDVPSEHLHCRLQPSEKVEIIRSLQVHRHVAMVGDGVNDVPALKTAHVGIAAEGASMAATAIADVVLRTSSLKGLLQLVSEGRSVLRTILAVAILFIGKNAVLMAVSLVSALSSIPYPLTPRRGALLSVLAVGLPAMVLAARPNSGVRIQSFFRELTAGVLRTTLAAVLALLAASWWLPGEGTTHLFVAIVSSLTASAVFVDSRSPSLERPLWVLCVCALFTFVGCLLAPDTVPVLSFVTTFYEVPHIDGSGLPDVLVSLAFAVGVTAAVHRLARRR